jgi:hypothetical protein
MRIALYYFYTVCVLGVRAAAEKIDDKRPEHAV